MAQPTLDVLDANALPVTVFTQNPNGRVAAANGQPVSLSTEDKAVLDLVATAAKQDTGNASVASIDTKLTSQATAAKQDTGNTSLASIDTKLTGNATAANQATQITSLASIDTKLTGNATGTKQDTGNASLASIDTKLSSQATAANQATQITALGTGNTSLASIDTKLTGNATAANQATQITSLASVDTKLSSQATAAKQDTGNTSLGSIDTKLSSQATAAKQDTIITSLATIDGHVDGLEALAAGTNTLLTAIAGGLATNGQAVMASSKPVTIASDQSPVAFKIDQTSVGTTDSVTVKASAGIGSLTETAPASDTASAGLNGRLQRVAQNLSSLLAELQGKADLTERQPVTSLGYKSQITITRPSDTTGYAIGDVVGDTNGSAILTFTSIGPTNDFTFITGADFRMNLAAVPSGMTSFRLHLYDAAPDAIADNAPWVLSSAGDRAAYLGYVDIGAPLAAGGSTLFVQTPDLAKQVKLLTGSSLFGLLVTNGTWTPTSAATYAIRLKTMAG